MVMQVIIVVLGAIIFATGVLQARAWRMSRMDEPFIRTAVAVLASSRLLAGLEFVVGGLARSWQLIVAGAICILIGNAAAARARRRLKNLDATRQSSRV